MDFLLSLSENLACWWKLSPIQTKRYPEKSCSSGLSIDVVAVYYCSKYSGRWDDACYGRSDNSDVSVGVWAQLPHDWLSLLKANCTGHHYCSSITRQPWTTTARWQSYTGTGAWSGDVLTIPIQINPKAERQNQEIFLKNKGSWKKTANEGAGRHIKKEQWQTHHSQTRRTEVTWGGVSKEDLAQ